MQNYTKKKYSCSRCRPAEPLPSFFSRSFSLSPNHSSLPLSITLLHTALSPFISFSFLFPLIFFSFSLHSTDLFLKLPTTSQRGPMMTAVAVLSCPPPPPRQIHQKEWLIHYETIWTPVDLEDSARNMFQLSHRREGKRPLVYYDDALKSMYTLLL